MIKCCMSCKPPVRYPGCHSHCPEYLKEKAQHDEQKAAEYWAKAIDYGLSAQRTNSVRRSIKKKGCKK